MDARYIKCEMAYRRGIPYGDPGDPIGTCIRTPQNVNPAVSFTTIFSPALGSA